VGAADGPSGAGSGHGDSVSTNVSFVPFLQERPVFCPALPPMAAFSGSPTSGSAPLQVQFVNTSTGNYTASQWDFGDGETSTLQNPTHLYTKAGKYSVSLTVSGPGGINSLTRTHYINVASSLHSVYLPLVLRE